MARHRKAVSNLREQGRASLLTVPVLFVLGAVLLSIVTAAADEVLSGLVPEAGLFRDDADSGAC